MTATVDSEGDLPAPGRIVFVAKLVNFLTTMIEIFVLAVVLVAVLDPLLPFVVLADTMPVIGVAVEVFPVRNTFLGAIGKVWPIIIVTRFDGRIARLNLNGRSGHRGNGG